MAKHSDLNRKPILKLVKGLKASAEPRNTPWVVWTILLVNLAILGLVILGLH